MKMKSLHTHIQQLVDSGWPIVFYSPGERGGNWRLQGGEAAGTILETGVRVCTDNVEHEQRIDIHEAARKVNMYTSCLPYIRMKNIYL